MQRCEVYYSGHVQGVGFRFTTQTASRQFQVTGFVQNLADGRVHLVAEGTSWELNRFLVEIKDRLGHYIRDEKLARLAATGEFSGFSIRH